MQRLDILFEMLAYAGSPTNNPADAIKVRNRIQDTEIIGCIRQKLQIADSTVDQTVTLPSSSTEYVAILVDQILTIKLNGGSESVTLSPRVSGTLSLAFFNRGNISSLSISNSSGSLANLDIIMADK